MPDSILLRLPPELRQLAERLAAEHGWLTLQRLAQAIIDAGAPRKQRGRGRPIRDDAALLSGMASLLAANPTWKPHRAAREVVAQHGNTRAPRIEGESLKRKLLRDWERNGADLLRRARTARAAQGLANAATAAVRALTPHEARRLYESAAWNLFPSRPFQDASTRAAEQYARMAQEIEFAERRLHAERLAERMARDADYDQLRLAIDKANAGR